MLRKISIPIQSLFLLFFVLTDLFLMVNFPSHYIGIGIASVLSLFSLYYLLITLRAKKEFLHNELTTYKTQSEENHQQQVASIKEVAESIAILQKELTEQLVSMMDENKAQVEQLSNLVNEKATTLSEQMLKQDEQLRNEISEHIVSVNNLQNSNSKKHLEELNAFKVAQMQVMKESFDKVNNLVANVSQLIAKEVPAAIEVLSKTISSKSDEEKVLIGQAIESIINQQQQVQEELAKAITTANNAQAEAVNKTEENVLKHTNEVQEKAIIRHAETTEKLTELQAYITSQLLSLQEAAVTTVLEAKKEVLSQNIQLSDKELQAVTDVKRTAKEQHDALLENIKLHAINNETKLNENHNELVERFTKQHDLLTETKVTFAQHQEKSTENILGKIESISAEHTNLQQEQSDRIIATVDAGSQELATQLSEAQVEVVRVVEERTQQVTEQLSETQTQIETTKEELLTQNGDVLNKHASDILSQLHGQSQNLATVVEERAGQLEAQLSATKEELLTQNEVVLDKHANEILDQLHGKSEHIATIVEERSQQVTNNLSEAMENVTHIVEEGNQQLTTHMSTVKEEVIYHNDSIADKVISQVENQQLHSQEQVIAQSQVLREEFIELVSRLHEAQKQQVEQLALSVDQGSLKVLEEVSTNSGELKNELLITKNEIQDRITTAINSEEQFIEKAQQVVIEQQEAASQELIKLINEWNRQHQGLLQNVTGNVDQVTAALENSKLLMESLSLLVKENSSNVGDQLTSLTAYYKDSTQSQRTKLEELEVAVKQGDEKISESVKYFLNSLKLQQINTENQLLQEMKSFMKDDGGSRKIASGRENRVESEDSIKLFKDEKLVKHIDKVDGSETDFTYNHGVMTKSATKVKGKLQFEMHYNKDGNFEKGIEYENNRVVFEYEYYPSGEIKQKVEYKYNKGKLLEKIFYTYKENGSFIKKWTKQTV